MTDGGIIERGRGDASLFWMTKSQRIRDANFEVRTFEGKLSESLIANKSRSKLFHLFYGLIERDLLNVMIFQRGNDLEIMLRFAYTYRYLLLSCF